MSQALPGIGMPVVRRQTWPCPHVTSEEYRSRQEQGTRSGACSREAHARLGPVAGEEEFSRQGAAAWGAVTSASASAGFLVSAFVSRLPLPLEPPPPPVSLRMTPGTRGLAVQSITRHLALIGLLFSRLISCI